MTNEFVRPDPLIDRLVADLQPVAPRRRGRELVLLLGLGVIEILLFVALRGMRPDLHQAMAGPAFWWKSGSLAVIAALSAAALLVSLDPAGAARRRMTALWWALGLALFVAMALGWLVDAAGSGPAALLARLDWHAGMDCLGNVVALSIPLLLAIGVLVRRGAPTQPARTGLAAGLAAAGFAAFVFAFHCDHDDPLYIAVWYGLGIAVIGGLTRLVLPRLTRW